ncbi:hypothetical protein GCM10023194_21510 [Planotetraspora phitsanulokensis]|uniref:Uncharacterized protein n=1 Tax=Planotetraspora phitsanulokensis TaxID=575192 RepID=A0A8J3XEV2_9ACTN|nr:hypothetical protein [Planotetraspora phitsanulokensis]GII38209.1 hypothetical protein Pph01_32120 [Planotetraspora phitsanulokensis]
MTEHPPSRRPYARTSAYSPPYRSPGPAVAGLLLGLACLLTGGCAVTGDHEVTFEVVGVNGTKTAQNVSFGVGFGTSYNSPVSLPFMKTEPAADDVHALSLYADAAGADGAITCRIKVDGKTVAESGDSVHSCHVETKGLGT